MAKQIYSIPCPPNTWTQLWAAADAAVSLRMISGTGSLALKSTQPTGDNSGNFMPLVALDQYMDVNNDNDGWFRPTYEPNVTQLPINVIVIK